MPARILVAAGDRIGKERQCYRTETGEASENLLLFFGGRPLFALDRFERADGRQDVSGLGFFASGDRDDVRMLDRIGLAESRSPGSRVERRIFLGFAIRIQRGRIGRRLEAEELLTRLYAGGVG